MTRAVLGRAAVFAAALIGAAPALAIIVGGGGAKGKDCLVVFQADANFPSSAPKQVRCTDGDPNCDADHEVNGICSLPVKVCLNSTFSSECSINGVAQINVDHSFDDGDDPKFDPDLLALRQRIGQDFSFPVTSTGVCTGTVSFIVPIKGPLGNNHCSRTKKKIKLHSFATVDAGSAKDTDTLKLYCEPNPTDGCDPQTLYDGTFDRIQHQIFTQHCAVGSCHDSQSQAGDMILETGAAYGNLVDHVTTNFSASSAGWLRVKTMPAPDPDASFLLHKIDGTLPDSTYGERMPRGLPKLPATLRDIVRLWIEAGAPQGGWVPGTF